MAGGRVQRDSQCRSVLGLSFGFHDAAAALVVDGEIVAAVEQERLSRRKHDPSFPGAAADCVMAIADMDVGQIDVVAFHQKPIAIIDRHLRSRLRHGPKAAGALLRDTPYELGRQLSVGRQIDRWFRQRGSATPEIHIAEHHTSHAAAAFYPSPFERAAVVTVDGVGEWATTTVAEGIGNRLRVERELRFPDSIGLLYSAFTSYCGFRVNAGEGELMGLAPFGEPVHAELIRERLLDIHDDASVHLAPRYFAYARGRRTTSSAFHELFGAPPRPLGSTPGQREADLAASAQLVLEELVLGLAEQASELTGQDQVCVGGGVGLNCVANGRLRRNERFADVWVQPAAGDAGNAIGAALWSWHAVQGQPRRPGKPDGMGGAMLGPSFGRAEIESWLTDQEVAFRRIDDDDERCVEVARRLCQGDAVGWFCGRMEFGPRALGHRSILADPRSSTIQARLNGLVKERAPFRPFAPAVLAAHAHDWFEGSGAFPYMTFAMPVRSDRMLVSASEEHANPGDFAAQVAVPRSEIPAVTHVDGSARVQSVDAQQNPEFARLLEAFWRETGCPVLLNTSFNLRDEPIVCTPADALATFGRSGLDLLVLEHCLVEPA